MTTVRFARWGDPVGDLQAFACPDCGKPRGSTQIVVSMDGRLAEAGDLYLRSTLEGLGLVRVTKAERDGWPCYGIPERKRVAAPVRPDQAHRPATGRPADPIHQDVEMEIRRPPAVSIGDYRTSVVGRFDTWCLSCGARMRVDLAQRR